MPYYFDGIFCASDFDGNWILDVAGQESESSESHKRHILDKEVLAEILNIAEIELTESEFKALKTVVNNSKVNMHPYKSKGANVGNSEEYAEKHDVNARKICDKSAVSKVFDSFENSKVVELSTHETAHIHKQQDVLLSDEFKLVLPPEKWEKLCMAYVELTKGVMGPSESEIYTDGKVIDARRFKVSPEAKELVRKSANKYLRLKQSINDKKLLDKPKSKSVQEQVAKPLRTWGRFLGEAAVVVVGTVAVVAGAMILANKLKTDNNTTRDSDSSSIDYSKYERDKAERERNEEEKKKNDWLSNQRDLVGMGIIPEVGKKYGGGYSGSKYQEPRPYYECKSNGYIFGNKSELKTYLNENPGKRDAGYGDVMKNEPSGFY